MAEKRLSKRDEELLKKQGLLEQEETEGESGTGTEGSSGAIEFHDFLIPASEILDDALPPDVKKRILEKHSQINEVNVKKQKDKRDYYKALKEGKIKAQSFQAGMDAGMDVKPHLLASTVQFGSGVIETQVNALPGELNEANQEKANQLRYQYQQRYTPEATPHFTPKPYPTR